MKKRIATLPCAAVLLCFAALAGCSPRMQEPAAQQPAPQEAHAADASETWDLTEYFADDDAFQAELRQLKETELPAYEKMAETVQDADGLLEWKQSGDALNRRIARLIYYAMQKGDLNAADSSARTQKNAATLLEQDFSLVNTALTNRLLAMDDAFWTAVFADERLSPYWRELVKMRENAAHTLTDAEEALLMPAYQAQNNMEATFSMLSYGSLPWLTVAAPDGSAVKANYTNYLSAMSNPDRAYRKAYLEAFVGTYGQYRDTFASNLNAYITLSEQLAVLHHYDSVLDSVTKENGITTEIYDALLEAGRNGADVLLREAELRKAVMQLNELYNYDSRVPLGSAEAPTYSYVEAQALIRAALAPLGQDYADVLDQAFSGRWIDVYPGENKDTGAYSGMSVDIHPWVLLNYAGDYSSVSTLAHELGHAVHQYRSYEAQQSYYAQAPTALVTEVASTFNEQLLSRYLIEHAESDAEKLYYVQQALETLRSTFFSQIAFADFERQFHAIVENGDALTADALDALYQENNRVYAPGYTYPEVCASYWASIPHFYYNYYVFSYAMAISVSCAAADAVYEGDAAMLEHYLSFLSAGNSADAAELFLRLGVDVTKTDYTKPLLARYAALLDLEEQLLGR